MLLKLIFQIWWYPLIVKVSVSGSHSIRLFNKSASKLNVTPLPEPENFVNVFKAERTGGIVSSKP